MFILGDILVTVANILHIVFGFYQWIILAAVIISWIRPAPSNDLIRTLLVAVSRMTQPLFYEIRKRLPRSMLSTGMDFTPMIAWLLIFGIDMFSYRILINIGVRLSSSGITSDPMQGLEQYDFQ